MRFRQLLHLNGQTSNIHYKLFKSKKSWVISTIATLGILTGLTSVSGLTAQATSQPATETQTAQQGETNSSSAINDHSDPLVTNDTGDSNIPANVTQSKNLSNTDGSKISNNNLQTRSANKASTVQTKTVTKVDAVSEGNETINGTINYADKGRVQIPVPTPDKVNSFPTKDAGQGSIFLKPDTDNSTNSQNPKPQYSDLTPDEKTYSSIAGTDKDAWTTVGILGAHAPYNTTVNGQKVSYNVLDGPQGFTTDKQGNAYISYSNGDAFTGTNKDAKMSRNSGFIMKLSANALSALQKNPLLIARALWKESLEQSTDQSTAAFYNWITNNSTVYDQYKLGEADQQFTSLVNSGDIKFSDNISDFGHGGTFAYDPKTNKLVLIGTYENKYPSYTDQNAQTFLKNNPLSYIQMDPTTLNYTDKSLYLTNPVTSFNPTLVYNNIGNLAIDSEGNLYYSSQYDDNGTPAYHFYKGVTSSDGSITFKPLLPVITNTLDPDGADSTQGLSISQDANGQNIMYITANSAYINFNLDALNKLDTLAESGTTSGSDWDNTLKQLDFHTTQIADSQNTKRESENTIDIKGTKYMLMVNPNEIIAVLPTTYTVRYQDTAGKDLVTAKTVTTAKVGDKVTTEAVNIPKYQLQGQSRQSKTLIDGTNTFTFVYAPVAKTATYTVHYVDANGKELANVPVKTVTTAKVGDKVTETAVSVPNYTLQSANSQSMTLINGTNNIIFTYAPAVKATTYTVHYVDANGKGLAPVKTVSTAKVGDKVTEKAVNVPNYILQGQSSQTVTLIDGINNFTFKYVPTVQTKSEVDTGVSVTKANYYDNLDQTTPVTKAATYTVHYVDANGKELANVPVKTASTGKVGDKVTEKAVTIPGYTLQGQSSQTVTLIDGTNSFTFKYVPTVQTKNEVADPTSVTAADYYNNTPETETIVGEPTSVTKSGFYNNLVDSTSHTATNVPADTTSTKPIDTSSNPQQTGTQPVTPNKPATNPTSTTNVTKPTASNKPVTQSVEQTPTGNKHVTIEPMVNGNQTKLTGSITKSANPSDNQKTGNTVQTNAYVGKHFATDQPNSAAANKLPQTDENTTETDSLISLGLASLLSVLGLGSLKKRRQD